MWRTTRAAVLAGVAILALAPATTREASLLVGVQTKEPSPLLGVVSGQTGATTVVSVDPRSLRPRPGRSSPSEHSTLLSTRSTSPVHRGRVYARVGGERRVRVLKLASGKQIGSRAESPPRLLLGARG